MTIQEGQMTDSPAAVIAQALIDKGVAYDPSGTASSWQISVDSSLDSPDDALEVHNTDPMFQARNQITGNMEGFHAFQLTVRSVDPEKAWTMANRIARDFDLLPSQNSESINYTNPTVVHQDSTSSNYSIGAVTRKSGPMYVGHDMSSSRRTIYTINAIVPILQNS